MSFRFDVKFQRNSIYFLAGVMTPVYVIFIYQYFVRNSGNDTHLIYHSGTIPENLSSVVNLIGYEPDSEGGCKFPKLDPYDPSIFGIVNKMQEKVFCPNEKFPLLFRTDLDSNLIMESCPFQVGLESCCYKTISRTNLSDTDVIYSECITLTSQTTPIPPNHEYIAVFCRNVSKTPKQTTSPPNGTDLRMVDVLGLTRLKPEVEDRIKNLTRNSTSENQDDQFSVIFLGVDSISHMNFIRTMPKSWHYIREDLEGVGMNGFVSVAGHTFPILVAAFSGYSDEELKNVCWPNDTSTFDKCPFIWKQFSAQGYRTFFGEDAAGMATFNYGRRGFQYPPTDYYLQPLIRAGNNEIGHHKTANAFLCHGPRLTSDVLLNYTLQFSTLMQKRKYFQIVWCNSIGHDDLNLPKAFDDNFLGTLQKLKNGGHLDTKILIIVSDHGMRFGEMRPTFQGQVEVRMPFLYIVLPEAFKTKYPDKAWYLKQNKNRLTSAFDMYETFKHILELDKKSAQKSVDEQPVFKPWAYQHLSNQQTNFSSTIRGRSLFGPIPMNRTCQSAGIPEHFCICRTIYKISHKDTIIVKAGEKFVSFLNTKLKNFTQCSNLSLANVSDAYNLIRKNVNVGKGTALDEDGMVAKIRISVYTLPGQAKFETTLTKGDTKDWEVVSFTRINFYKDQSHCVEDVGLKNFCFCKDKRKLQV